MSSVTLRIIFLASALSFSYAAQCGDCWCVPGNGGLDDCPSWSPQDDFSPELLADLKSKTLTNPFDPLTCDPYSDPSCKTTPPQQYVDSPTAVCGMLFSGPSEFPCGTYSLRSYNSADEALDDSAYITHTGACGLCSTSQDLYAYITQPDMTHEGKKCATKGLIHEEWGKKCYMNLGFTEPCAEIWNYDGIYDGKKCAGICVLNLFADNNGPPPACELNDCLECDEDEAGPVFKEVAGRTRRRSGLNEEIGRGCDEFAKIDIDKAMC
ncbi:hypothetical protein TrST_g11988 [Triparma strigata]|uniref:Uncharacterized protein n=1 Tax=Triparma strigata TaxID=1606541 RepID=A0A9W7A9N1_9STRA|nr:hypothetical protein TrST_g11988 [Triparma strigata]